MNEIGINAGFSWEAFLTSSFDLSLPLIYTCPGAQHSTISFPLSINWYMLCCSRLAIGSAYWIAFIWRAILRESVYIAHLICGSRLIISIARLMAYISAVSIVACFGRVACLCIPSAHADAPTPFSVFDQSVYIGKCVAYSSRLNFLKTSLYISAGVVCFRNFASAVLISGSYILYVGVLNPSNPYEKFSFTYPLLNSMSSINLFALFASGGRGGARVVTYLFSNSSRLFATTAGLGAGFLSCDLIL